MKGEMSEIVTGAKLVGAGEASIGAGAVFAPSSIDLSPSSYRFSETITGALPPSYLQN